MESLKKLAAQMGVPLSPPATPDEISAFEAKAGFPLTDSLRDLYLTSNGCVFAPGRLEILSLDGAWKFVEGMRRFGIPQIRKYFPLTDNNDSNPFCVCCDDVMRGCVVRVNHDDTAKLYFRSLEDFLTAMSEFLTPERLNLFQLPSDMDRPERTASDIELGRRVLDQVRQLQDVESIDTLRFGLCLLSDQQIAEIAPYLDDTNHEASREAKERLRAIGTPGAMDAIEKFEERMRQFAVECVQALSRAGMTPTLVDNRSVRVDRDPVWLNIPMFYAMRQEKPDIFDFVVQRARYFLKLKSDKEQGLS